MAGMDEQDLADWRRYRGGDSRAFSQIFRRHKDHLMTYCVYVGLTRDMAEDIVQESFATLAEQQGEIASLRSWLFVCTKNATLNQLKKLRRESGPVAISEPEATLSPDAGEFIRRVLAQLTADERDLILRRELHDFSVRELAEMEDSSEEAIRVRLFRIRKKMYELGKAYR